MNNGREAATDMSKIPDNKLNKHDCIVRMVVVGIVSFLEHRKTMSRTVHGIDVRYLFDCFGHPEGRRYRARVCPCENVDATVCVCVCVCNTAFSLMSCKRSGSRCELEIR